MSGVAICAMLTVAMTGSCNQIAKLMINSTIGVIGLGYVGFPLACLFSRRYKVIGFDLNGTRVKEINEGTDITGEVSDEKVAQALQNGMQCTTDMEALRLCNIYIVAVPTPVDKHYNPDLTPLESASATIGKVIKRGDYVIYESTVYPGATEEVCIPIIEKVSGMRAIADFAYGYSPERINPGDREHTVENIKKITSGCTPEVAEFIDQLYNSVLLNGTYRASSVKVAEAAKIIENTQRDVNIAFINEITQMFTAMDINPHEVIEAASTKWNFIKLRPGLVGGHCISVDPYYLIQRANLAGYNPRVITQARQVNETMGGYIANIVVRRMTKRGLNVKHSNILILGFTFKENCKDIRNTKVVHVFEEMAKFTRNITIYDSWADIDVVKREYGVDITADRDAVLSKKYGAIIYCVDHADFHSLDLNSLLEPEGVVYSVPEGTFIVGGK